MSKDIDENIHENKISKKIQNSLTKKEVVKATPSFVDRSSNVVTSFEKEYETQLKVYVEKDLISQEHQTLLVDAFMNYVKSVLDEENKKESHKLSKKINKELFKQLEEFLEVSVSKPDDDFWASLETFYKQSLNEALKKYTLKDGSLKFPLNFDEEESQAYIKQLSADNI